jgi:hypothetical protein
MNHEEQNARERQAVAPDGRLFDGRDVFWAGLVFFASYFFYLISLYPTVTSEDSGEFAAAAHTLGVAHPPGYPLFVILAKIFTVLVPFGDIAWRVNVFSAFFGAAAVAGIYLLAKLLAKDPAIGVITALVFAGGEIYWSQAIRAEVYALNTFFLVLLILLAVIWYFNESLPQRQLSGQHQKSSGSRLIQTLAFIYGLSLGNHHLMLLAGPPLLIFFLIAKPKMFYDFTNIAKMGLFFMLGLGIYMFLPLAASYKPEVNWGNPVTWDNFWTHVLRRIYSADGINSAGELVSSAQSAAQTGTQETPFMQFLRLHVWEFAKRFIVILDGNYTWITGLMAVFGGIFLHVRAKAVFWFFITLVIFNSSVMSAVTGVGLTGKLPSLYFTDRPFFIPLLLLITVMGGLGIRYLASLSYARGKRTAPATKRPLAIIFIAIVFIAVLAFKYPAQNQSGNYIAHDIARATLDMLPEDAVLISENGDNTIFPILYLQTVKKYRTDVKIYINMPFSVYRYFRTLEETEAENPGSRLFTDFPFGANPGREYVHMGPVAEIVPEGAVPETSPSGIPTVEKIRGIDSGNLDFFHLYIKARYLLDLGLVAPQGSPEQKALFEKAFAVAPLSRNITGQLIGNFLVRNGYFSDAIAYLKAAHEYLPHEYPINFQLALSLIITGDFASADELIANLDRATRTLLIKELGIYTEIRGADHPNLTIYQKGKQ